MANNSKCLFTTTAALLLTAPCLAGQVRWFPTVRPFEYPIGARPTSGVVGRLISVTRGESRFGAEREADVSIGENLPVLGFGAGAAPAFLGLTVRVGGRFSLDDPKSSLIGNDWVAGIHGVVDRGPWRVAVDLYHESSHLGDEYAERFSVKRVDWTREVISLWVERQVGRFTVHGTGSYTPIDELSLPRGALGAGLSFRGRPGAAVQPVVGVAAESAEYGGWKVTTSGRAGVEVIGPRGAMGLSLVFLNGLSPQRQFFRGQTRFYGFELRFDF